MKRPRRRTRHEGLTRRVCPGHASMVLAAALLAMACTPHYPAGAPVPRVCHSVAGLKQVFFMSNTSQVHFSDLGTIHATRPAIEGFFDRVYPISQLPDVLRPELGKARPFTPEAEWVLRFRKPLPPTREEFERGFPGMAVRFEGMIEGKWLDSLRSKDGHAATQWIPASGGNNFYVRVDDVAQLPSDYRPVRAWDEDFASDDPDIRKRLDDAVFCISHGRAETDRDGKQRQAVFKARFGDMRHKLFDPRRGFGVGDLVRTVGEHYYSDTVFAPEIRRQVEVRGINLGAHGKRSALVNCPSCRRRAFMRLLCRPWKWRCGVSCSRQAMRQMADVADARHLTLRDTGSVDVQHHRHGGCASKAQVSSDSQ